MLFWDEIKFLLKILLLRKNILDFRKYNNNNDMST